MSAPAWETVIGLEVHAQVASKAKLFSDASTAYGAEPNTQVSFVDAAMPGMLPVINRACVAQAVKTGLGLNGKIHLVSEFARKNYFYPDLPSGYQISQYDKPLVGEGWLEIETGDGVRKIGIERLHLEQDAGKLLHDQSADASLVDLNRAGVALMEIVSRPDLRSAAEAESYVRKLRALLRGLGTCDGNMEEGSLRVDINVSVRRRGAPLGTRCEVKNVNSFRFMAQAIAYEERRQIALLEAGGEVAQETRLFDAGNGETRPMRSKEDAHDYRYFPEPDLPPLVLEQAWVDALAADLPELPEAKRARFMGYGLSAYDAEVLTSDGARAAYFEAALDCLPEAERAAAAKPLAHWVTGDVAASLNEAGKGFAESPVPPPRLVALWQLQARGTISGRIAKEVWAQMFASGDAPDAIIAAQGLTQVSDESEIAKVVDALLAEEAEKWAQVQDKPRMLGWFVGQVMARMAGKANPQAVQRLLRSRLSKD